MPARQRSPGSVDRGEQSASGSVQAESRVLPRRLLTESRQSLNKAPDGSRILLVLFRQRVGSAGLLSRQIESPHSAVDYLLARRADFLGSGSQEDRAIGVEVCVEHVANF